VRHISKFIEHRDTIVALLELMKKIDISNEDKQKIYDAIMSMKSKTEMQKDRFTRYIGVKPKEFKRETYKELAESYGCSISAIRCSVYSTQAGLYRIQDNGYAVLEKVYKKYQY
jgi:hypothetical protein